MIGLRKKVILGACAFALGFSLYEGVTAVRLRDEVRAGRENLTRLAAAARQAQSEVESANRQLAQRVVSRPKPLPRFPPGSDAALTAEITAWLGRVAALRKALADHPELRIPEMRLLTDDDWLHAAYGVTSWTTVTDTAGSSVEIDFLPNLENLRTIARQSFMSKLAGAVQRYRVENQGELPASFPQLAPLLPASINPGIIARYDFSRENSRLVIAEISTAAVDPENLAVLEYDGAHAMEGFHSGFESPLVRTVREADVRYADAHAGMYAITPAQLAPFLPSPMNPTQLAESFDRLPNAYRRPPEASP